MIECAVVCGKQRHIICETDINYFSWLLSMRKDYKNVLKLTPRFEYVSGHLLEIG